MGLAVVVGGVSLFVSHDGQPVKSDAGGASSHGTSGVVVVCCSWHERDMSSLHRVAGSHAAMVLTDKGNGERERVCVCMRER